VPRLYSIVALRLRFRELYEELYYRFLEELKAFNPYFFEERVGNIVYLVFNEGAYYEMVEFVKRVADKYGIVEVRDANIFVYGFRKPGTRVI